MTGSTRSSAGLDERRRRMLFRAWHRGTKEMDLLLGRFADAEIAGLDDAELTALEAVMAEADWDLFAWITGAREIPAPSDTAMLRRIIAFHAAPK